MSMALVMSQMPDVWRKVLAEHVGDERGRCRACRNANGETAAWPCQTYRVAQEAKWVSEGNLPGTGPHGADGPSATPRLSPLEDPRYRAPAPAPFAGDPAPSGWGGSGFDLPSGGGWTSTGGDDHLFTYPTLKFFPDASPTSTEEVTFSAVVGEGVLNEDLGGDEIYGKLILTNEFTLNEVKKNTNQVNGDF